MRNQALPLKHNDKSSIAAQARMVFLDNDKCQPQCAYGGGIELPVI